MTFHDQARHVASQLRAKLDAAALEVLQAGGNWGEGPYEFNDPGLFPAEPRSLFEPLVMSVEVKGGPVPDDWVPPHGWRMIRQADWVAAGKPGAKPRCPTCGATGYRSLKARHGELHADAVCRAGHPYSVLRSAL